jgi:hypothetical protein
VRENRRAETECSILRSALSVTDWDGEFVNEAMHTQGGEINLREFTTANPKGRRLAINPALTWRL